MARHHACLGTKPGAATVINAPVSARNSVPTGTNEAFHMKHKLGGRGVGAHEYEDGNNCNQEESGS